VLGNVQFPVGHVGATGNTVSAKNPSLTGAKTFNGGPKLLYGCQYTISEAEEYGSPFLRVGASAIVYFATWNIPRIQQRIVIIDRKSLN
jgi:hypothetical protein